MSRTTSLLLILLLALGVFIYLNPAAREQATAAWQDIRTFFVELYVSGSASLKDLISNG